jgi:hypothetical protein
VLDSVDALNEKLSFYRQWIKELELGLAQEAQLHPLLNIELLRMTDDTPEEREEVLEAFGTLELGKDGNSRWMGPQAISSWVLRVSWLFFFEPRVLSTSSHISSLYQRKSENSKTFPDDNIVYMTNGYSGVSESDLGLSSRDPLHSLLRHLPAKEIFDAMITSYYDYATWL